MDTIDIEPEMLIELVKKHRNIYDKSHFKFKNKVARFETFNIIAKALGYPDQGENCELKWRSLRNRFCTELRQLSIGNPTNTPPRYWRYFDMMKWLEKYITPRQKYFKKYANFGPLKYVKSDLISEPSHSEDNDVILNEALEIKLPSISSLDHEYGLRSDRSPKQSKHNHVCGDSDMDTPTERKSITSRTGLSSDSSAKHNHVHGNSDEYKPPERYSIATHAVPSSDSSSKHNHVQGNSDEYKPPERYSIATHAVPSSDSSPKHNHVYRNSDQYKPTERNSGANLTEEEDYLFGKMVAKYLTRIKNLDKKLQAKMEILNVFKTTRDEA